MVEEFLNAPYEAKDIDAWKKQVEAMKIAMNPERRDGKGIDIALEKLS